MCVSECVWHQLREPNDNFHLFQGRGAILSSYRKGAKGKSSRLSIPAFLACWESTILVVF